MNEGQTFTSYIALRDALKAHGTIVSTRDEPGGRTVSVMSDGNEITYTFTPAKDTNSKPVYTVESIAPSTGPADAEGVRLAEFFAAHGEVIKTKNLPAQKVNDRDYSPRKPTRYEFADGAYITVVPADTDADGNVRIGQKIIDQGIPKPAKSGAGSTRPAQDIKIESDPNNPGKFLKVTREIDAQGNGIRVVKSEPYTPTAGNSSGLGQDIRVEPDPNNPGKFVKVTRSVDAQGNGVQELKREPYTPPVSEQVTNRSQTVSTNTTEPYIVERVNGELVTTKNPNYVPPKPTLIDLPNGGKGQLVPNPAKPGEWIAQPIAGTQAPALPAGIGQFRPDANKEGYGLYERRDELLKLLAEDKITEAQLKEVLASDRELTNTWATQQSNWESGANTAYDNVMTQRAQNITQAGQRLSAADSQYNAALNFANQNAVGIARAGTMDIISPLLRSQMLHAQRMGGLENAPDVPLPKALSRYMELDIPGVGTLKIHGDSGAGAGTGVTSDQSAVASQESAPPVDVTPSGGMDQGQLQDVQDAPPATAAAIENLDPRKRVHDLFNDDPDFQSHVARVLGMDQGAGTPVGMGA